MSMHQQNNANFSGNENIYQTQQYYQGSAGINQLIGNTQVHAVNSPEYIYNAQQQQNNLRDSLSSASRGTPQQQNQRVSSKMNAAQNSQRQSMGMANTVVHQTTKMQNSSKPMYENPITGSDADFVYNNLLLSQSSNAANNNQVNNMGSNVQGYTMNAANLNANRKSANKGSNSNTNQQRHAGGQYR